MYYHNHQLSYINQLIQQNLSAYVSTVIEEACNSPLGFNVHIFEAICKITSTMMTGSEMFISNGQRLRHTKLRNNQWMNVSKKNK